MTAVEDNIWVRIQGLDKRFDAQHALRHLDLDIGRGELVSLLGPSGCGKTTTLRLIAGFETPTAGSVTIGGRNILSEQAHRRGMGVVFQNYALFPHLSAADNVAFGLRLARRHRTEIAARVDELLTLVGLPHARDKFPDQMSGGQQQRVAIARALAINPQMLLLDEPLSALDAVIRLELRNAIRDIQQRLGVTTLFVTHDQEEALAISDRVVVMRDGRIEQVGIPEDIYARPATRFVAGFIGRGNIFEGRVADPANGQIDLGAFDATVSPSLLAGAVTGAPLALVVRPDAVSVGPNTSQPGSNAVSGTVAGSTFQGGSRHLEIQTDTGLCLAANVPAAHGASWKIGDRVCASFAPEACHVILGAAA
ncbi:ABC transporter ATP-binding protein [Devosia sp. 2618]|uniref:ABC transporter ATP-binding protein n=1 Tax=Devosia sp. 2618 TaxID=3156454 RepID=UPI003395DF08